MIDLTVFEIGQLVDLLVINFFGAFLLGLLIGWYLCRRYECGLYCHDCGILLKRLNDQDSNNG